MSETKHLTHKNATHLLNCSRNTWRTTQWYTMRCYILKEMPDGDRFKVLVFGERNWGGREHKSRVRYVDKYRVRERKRAT